MSAIDESLLSVQVDGEKQSHLFGVCPECSGKGRVPLGKVVLVPRQHIEAWRRSDARIQQRLPKNQCFAGFALIVAIGVIALEATHSCPYFDLMESWIAEIPNHVAEVGKMPQILQTLALGILWGFMPIASLIFLVQFLILGPIKKLSESGARIKEDILRDNGRADLIENLHEIGTMEETRDYDLEYVLVPSP